MDDTQVAPPAAPPQPDPVAAPPPEQAPTSDPAPGSDAYGSLQRAYTQVSQKNAAIAAALGIPKTSTTEQFVNAISARRQTLAQADADLASDPRLAAQMAELRAREERLVRQQYGDAADLALNLRDAVASSASLLDIVALVDEHLADRVASRMSAASAPAATPAVSPQAAPQTAPVPERQLPVEFTRTENGVNPGITPDREKGPAGYMSELIRRIPALQR